MKAYPIRNTFSSLQGAWSKALLLCLGILLSPFYALSQGGCDCPPISSCNACDGGLTSVILHYTGGGLPLLVTAVDGAGHSVPGGINLLTNIITISSHAPTEAFHNGSVTVTVTALFGAILGSETITTSCAVPIFEGSAFGNLTVVSGSSLNGGPLCCIPSIQDDEAPTFSDPCPANIQLFTPPGSCTASTSWDPPDAIDNCGPVTLVGSHNALGTNFPIGITTVTYEATDEYDNQAVCSFTVEVIDNVTPIMTACPADADIALSASCSYTVTDFTTGVTATDNCDVNVVITQSPVAGTVLTGVSSIHTITLTATDDAGNIDVCTFEITLKDQSNPVISSCPANFDVPLGASCSYTVANFTGLATATDNCDASVAITQSPAIGTVLSGIGSTHTITLTATDNVGNTNACTFVITLKDQTNPVISSCPANMDVPLGASCSYAVADFTGLVTATDNCDASVAITQSPAVGTVLTGVGSNHTITLTATDNVGNTNACTFVITLKDQTNPVISSCPANMDVPLSTSCSYTVADFTGLVTATDNCDASVAITQSPAAGTVLTGVGSNHTITLTATDNVGNINACTFVIILKDQINPVISSCPPNFDVPLGASCSYAVANFTGLVTATDNCDASVAITQSPAIGTVLSGIGSTHTITLTATDNVGNTNACTFVITLKDQTNPAISTCPANMDVPLSTSCSYTVVDFTGLVTATDNCDASVAITQSPAIGTVLSGIGSTHTITLTATDNVGNTNACTFVITLKDQTNPVISSCPANMDVPLGTSCSYTVANFTGLVTATDNCDASVAITQSPAVGTVLTGVGSNHTITLTATDNVGNTNACTFQITLKDQTNPVISSCPANFDVPLGASCSYTVANFTGLVTATDNCDASVAITQSPAIGTVLSGIGSTHTITLTATDNVGNTNACTFVITLKDQTNPIISGCPGDINVNADPLLTCGANVNWNPPSATDNCTVNVSPDHASGTFFPVGETTVTYTATDLSGNSNLCSFKVTVIDSPPAIAAMNDITVPVGSSSCVANVSWNLPLVTDNCNLLSVTTDITSGSPFSLGSTPVTITANDTDGNTSTLVFNVIVVDDISPVITAMPDIIVSPTSGCNATVIWLPPPTTDNCTVQTIVSDIPPGSTFVPGKTTVTYTATDVNGNSSTESFDVVVTDNVPPVINCLSDITASATSGCGANVTWSNPAIIDCSNYTVSSSHSSGDFFPTGTSTVIYTVTDAAGNSSSCSFNVIINDFTTPVFSNCPVQVNVIANSCETQVTWVPPSATDNCNVSAVTSTHTSGTLFPIGVSRVTYTAVDGSGNTSSCSFDVTVTDGNSPVINDCPSNLTILVASSGQTEVTWVEPTASVGCGTVELTSTHKPGDVFSLGTTEVKYTATDNAGRTSQCSFNVETIYTEIDFAIADLVTPNGDGINDFWDLGDLERFIDNNVTIVDRWGGVVYNASGYNNKTVVWSGQNKKGGTVPTGTYFYRISVRLGDSKVERNGFIELVR